MHSSLQRLTGKALAPGLALLCLAAAAPPPLLGAARAATDTRAASSAAGGTSAPAAGATGSPGTATTTTTPVPSPGTPPAATTAPASVPTTPATGSPARSAQSIPTLGTAGLPAGKAAQSGKSASTKSEGDHPLSSGALLIAALAMLLLLGCAAWALARRRAFEPHWLLSLRHAIAEAGFRASATWAEFTDWIRLGH